MRVVVERYALQCWYKHFTLWHFVCRLLQWQDERAQQPHNILDVHDGTHWQSYILGDQHFCPDGKHHRTLALIFCGDGVNTFKPKSYSLWPLALACANLPAHLRRTLPATWLPCIVPAQGHKKSEPGNFQVFLEIVVMSSTTNTM